MFPVLPTEDQICCSQSKMKYPNGVLDNNYTTKEAGKQEIHLSLCSK